MTGERSEGARDRARTALAHVLMEYDAGRIVVEPEPGMAVPPGGKPTRFHRAWADAILAALQADPDAARAVVALLGGEAFVCDWQPDDLNPGPDCPYCAGDMCARFDGLRCNHTRAERHGAAPQDDREAETLSADEVEIIRSQAAEGDGVYYLFGARHDILALLATLDAAVSARQEAERVLADIVPAYHIVEHGHVSASWKDCPLDSCSSARATLARTREPAGDGTDG